MPRYEDETFPAILQRLLGEVDDEFDKREGSHVYNMQAPTAAELAQAYIALDQVLTFGFASEDMPREYLELRAHGEMGLPEIEAQKAVGELTFTTESAVEIPAGTRVRTDDGDDSIYAITTETVQAEADTPVTVAASAEEAGADGNVSADELTVVLGDLSSVAQVTNEDAFEGGADEESDEALLERYFNRTQEPATSGNVAQYRQWAADQAGVGKARVFPLHNGPGTVRVVLIGDDMTAPDSVIVDDTQAYIDPNQNGDGEGAAPIGATATVEPAVEVAMNITADLVLASDATMADVQADFEEGLRKYLAELVEADDALVRYTQVTNVLLGVPRVVDFDNLTLNGATSNVEVGDDEVPVVGTVTFNEQV